MSKLRIGYIGCGFMAQKVHIPNIVSLGECELVALAEARPKLGALVQARYRIPKLYANHLELAKDRSIDAVAVSAHYALQGDIAVDLLNAGKDVFMEKPMAISLEQGQRIIDAEKRSGKRLMVGYMKRYDAGNIKVKQLLESNAASGELGKIRFVRNHGFGGDWTAGLDTPMDGTDEAYPPFSIRWPSWLPERQRDGYINYLQQYTHNVNLVRWFLGGAPGATAKAAQLDPQDGVRGVVVIDAGGVPVTIESGWVAYEGWDEHTQIYLDGGWIRTEAPPLLLRNVPATVELYRAKDSEKAKTSFFPENGRLWSYKEEMRHFVTNAQSGKPFTSSATDTLEDVRLLEDIYKLHIQNHGEAAKSAKAAK
jgi:predicted dehydrogenase